MSQPISETASEALPQTQTTPEDMVSHFKHQPSRDTQVFQCIRDTHMSTISISLYLYTVLDSITLEPEMITVSTEQA